MKVVMTVLVRNEADILEANLAFHRNAGIDFFIVTDNRSTDATPDILRRWEARGLVRVIVEEDDTYAQGAWVTRMARLAATEHDATWVVNADADEFFLPRRGSIPDALATLPAGVGQVLASRVDFPATQESERLIASGVPFWRAMQVRDVTSTSSLGVPLPPKVVHRADPEVIVEQGNHAVRSPAWPAPPSGRSPFTVLHFPERCFAQLDSKIRLGGAAYARNTTLDPSVGSTWRALYEVQTAGGLRARYDAALPAEETLRAGIEAGSYVLDRRLATRLERLLPDEPTDRATIDRIRAIHAVGVVVGSDEVTAEPRLLEAWHAAFDADDPVTLVIDARGRPEEEIHGALLTEIQRVGLDADDAADVLVEAAAGGSLDRARVGCRILGRLAAQPSDGVAVTPGGRDEMRRAVLGGEPPNGGTLGNAEAEEIVDRAMSVEGHLTRRECRALVDLAAAVGRSHVVEIGSFRGRSTIALALGAPAHVSVIAVDPHEEFVGEHGGHFGPADRVAFFENLLREGVADRVRLINLPSVAAAAAVEGPVHLLWVDGDHSDAGVTADFHTWQRTLAPRATVAFHDAADPTTGPGRVAAEAVASGRYEFVDRVDKIVVVRRVD
ncbi:MAG: hypothetical protein JWM98_2131 [Thermoleophilia bacterium]|nr:hypothetical protein [Thermoleophilia bacterium]